MAELSGVDVEILTVLVRSEMALPPKAIALAADRDVSYRGVQERLRELDSRGLTERLDDPRGYRRHTERGVRALQKSRRVESANA